MSPGRATPGLLLVIGGLGLSLLGAGAWIPAKAWLAQQLIARAWHRAQAGEERPRPWPWADTWPVARLLAPDHAPPLYVLAGSSGESLAFGPAHVSASAPPDSADNVAFAGHRDTHFAFLARLEIGDPLVVETTAGQRRYRVAQTRVVHESRIDLVERTGHSELTLITCYPFDAIVPGGPLRYVVHARHERGGEVRREGSGQPERFPHPSLNRVDRRMAAGHADRLADEAAP